MNHYLYQVYGPTDLSKLGYGLMIMGMVVKIPIWILRSYDFTISPTQNDLNLSRIFAVVQDR